MLEQGRRAELEPWYPQVVAALQAWYFDKIQTAQSDDVESLIIPADDALHAALTGIPGLPLGHAAAIAAWPTSAGTPAEDPAANRAWGMALGQASVTLLDSAPAFQHTQEIVAGRPASDAYLAALAVALDGGARDSVLAKMSDIVARICSLEACYVLPRYQDDYPRILDGWRHTARVQDVWDLRGLEELGGSCNEVWLLDAVRRYDRGLYLDLLEQTRHPLAIQQAFNARSVDEDIGEIQDLLAAAPVACTILSNALFSGEWLHRLTAPLLLELALRQAETLVHLVQSPAFGPTSLVEIDILRGDLSTSFRSLVEVLLNRPDGYYLAGRWTLHLADRLAHLPWPAPLTAVSIAFQVLTEAIAAAGIDADAFQAATPAIDVQGSTLGALMVLIALQRSPNEANSRAREKAPALISLNTILDDNHTDLSSARDANPPSWVHAYVGMLFVQVSDPYERWNTAWAKLASQRQKMLHNTGLGQLRADEPSLFLLYASIAVIRLFLANETSEPLLITSLWHRLFDATLTIVLRLGTWSKRPSAVRWRRALVVLWALLPSIIEREGRQFDGDELSVLMQRLGGDDELLIEALAYLHQSGIPAADLCDAAARVGANLDAKRPGGVRSYFCQSRCTLAPALYRWRTRPPNLRTLASDPLSLDRFTVFAGKYRPRQHAPFDPVDKCRSIMRELVVANAL